MKYLAAITISLLLLFNNCAPSLRQLESFETVQALEKGYLLITLENHSEEIMLLKKYGQHKKAEKIAKKDAKFNTNIKQAIAKNYDYSQVAFTYANKYSDTIEYESLTGEPISITEKNKIYSLTFYNKTNYNDDREVELMALKITPKYNSFLESSTVFVEANVNNNLSGYNHLLKKMNLKLYRLNRAAEENLVYQEKIIIQ